MCNRIILKNKPNASPTASSAAKMSLEHQQSPCDVTDRRLVYSPAEDNDVNRANKPHPATNQHDDDQQQRRDVAADPTTRIAVPRQISITSSSSFSSSSASSSSASSSNECIDRQYSSESLSSLSSVGSDDDASPSAAAVAAPPLALSPLSPRRAIFGSYWKKSSDISSIKIQSQEEEEEVDDKGRGNDTGEEDAKNIPLRSAIPPPPPLFQADENLRASNRLAAAFFAMDISEDEDKVKVKAKVSNTNTNTSEPNDKSPKSPRRNIFESLRSMTSSSSTLSPPSSPATSSGQQQSSSRNHKSPKSHLTKAGLMLAQQAQQQKQVPLTPPSSPYLTPRSDGTLTASYLLLPPQAMASPLRPCLKRGSSWTKYSQDESMGTCESTPSSSSDSLHDLQKQVQEEVAQVPEGRVRSSSTVSFCPTVSIIEFDSSQELKDEELIRPPQANKDDWSKWFAA